MKYIGLWAYLLKDSQKLSEEGSEKRHKVVGVKTAGSHTQWGGRLQKPQKLKLTKKAEVPESSFTSFPMDLVIFININKARIIKVSGLIISNLLPNFLLCAAQKHVPQGILNLLTFSEKKCPSCPTKSIYFILLLQFFQFEYLMSKYLH